MVYVAIFSGAVALAGLLMILFERRNLEREVLAVLHEQRASYGNKPLTATRVTKAISIRRHNAAYNSGERNQKRLGAVLRSTCYTDVRYCLERLRDRGTVHGIKFGHDAFVLGSR